jgi:hypothetical protein
MLKNATKVISIVIVLTMVVGAFAVLMTAGSAKTSSAEKAVIADVERMDVDPQMKAQSLNVGELYYRYHALASSTYRPGEIYNINDTALFLTGGSGKWAYNDTDPSDFMLFKKRAERTSCEIWVATDLSFFDGDPRNDGRIVINDSAANYMADQFNDTISPVETQYFGPPPANDGSDSELDPYFGTNVSGRVMIMIFNIVDNSFFYSWYPYYTAGYFSPSIDELYDRNIIHIDNWDWNNRTTEFVPRPFVYESTVAHEYEHLLNNFQNPAQESFLDEGCAMYAEMLCGYGVPWGHIDRFLATPDNSLIEWNDQGDLNNLADYGAAALYVIWLNDHFGSDFIVHLVNTTWEEVTYSGIAAVNAAFENLGWSKWDFDRSFNSWRLANLISADSPGNGLYNYKSLNVAAHGGPRVYAYYPTEDYAQSGDSWIDSAAWEFGKTITYEGYVLDVSKVGSYGTDYVGVQGLGPSWHNGIDSFEAKFGFEGDTDVKTGWQTIDVPVTTGDVLFEDDFNHGGALPNWTMSTGAGAGFSYPWYAEWNDDPDNLFPVAFNYQANQPGLVMDEWMVMNNSFSTEGYTHLEIAMKNDFQRYAYNGEFGAVYFSVDNGTTWKVLQAYTQNSVYRAYMWPFMNGYADVSINADDIAGFGEVKLAFRYFSDNSFARGRWWAFDDLQVTAVETTKMWWSGTGSLKDYRLVGDLDLTSYEEEDVILGLDTKWGIECDTGGGWDFGFVQVSTDGGATWVSVEGTYTTMDHNPSAKEEIVNELPGITDYNPSWGNSGWAALDHAEYDLSAYAGEVVKVRFRYMTDWGTEYEGWFIKNVMINGEVIDNADTLIAFTPDPAYSDAEWMVSIFATNYGSTSIEDGVYYLPIVMNLNLNDDQSVQKALDSLIVYQYMYILISPKIGPADYGFGIYNTLL